MKSIFLALLVILVSCQREIRNEVGVGYNKELIIPPTNDLPQPKSADEKIMSSEQKEGLKDTKQSSSSDLVKAIHERIRLEASMNAMKVDISEELERIKSHIRELRDVVDNDRVLKGKRLDFLAQELHREANTIGAKAFNQDLNMISLDLRIYIEQIREQVQNLQ